jgi:hypothetical protein
MKDNTKKKIITVETLRGTHAGLARRSFFPPRKRISWAKGSSQNLPMHCHKSLGSDQEETDEDEAEEIINTQLGGITLKTRKARVK